MFNNNSSPYVINNLVITRHVGLPISNYVVHLDGLFEGFRPNNLFIIVSHASALMNVGVHMLFHCLYVEFSSK
jgi:hypothetical protein